MLTARQCYHPSTCGHFTNRHFWREIDNALRVIRPEEMPNVQARYNVAPTQDVAVAFR